MRRAQDRMRAKGERSQARLIIWTRLSMVSHHECRIRCTLACSSSLRESKGCGFGTSPTPTVWSSGHHRPLQSSTTDTTRLILRSGHSTRQTERLGSLLHQFQAACPPPNPNRTQSFLTEPVRGGRPARPRSHPSRRMTYSCPSQPESMMQVVKKSVGVAAACGQGRRTS